MMQLSRYIAYQPGIAIGADEFLGGKSAQAGIVCRAAPPNTLPWVSWCSCEFDLRGAVAGVTISPATGRGERTGELAARTLITCRWRNGSDLVEIGASSGAGAVAGCGGSSGPM
jgi:hypothetical protein